MIVYFLMTTSILLDWAPEQTVFLSEYGCELARYHVLHTEPVLEAECVPTLVYSEYDIR